MIPLLTLVLIAPLPGAFGEGWLEMSHLGRQSVSCSSGQAITMELQFARCICAGDRLRGEASDIAVREYERACC